MVQLESDTSANRSRLNNSSSSITREDESCLIKLTLVIEIPRYQTKERPAPRQIPLEVLAINSYSRDVKFRICIGSDWPKMG